MKSWQVAVKDETGQRNATVTVDEDDTWERVTATAVEVLDLPRFVPSSATEEEPAVYHPFWEEQGESLVGTAGDTLARYWPVTVLVAPEMTPAAHRAKGHG